MATRSIDNSEDIIDSRDVIARIEELASTHEALTHDVDMARDALDAYVSGAEGDVDEDTQTSLADALEEAQQALQEFTDGDEQEELSKLRALADQCEGYGDWAYGEALINDSYFERYAEQLAEDIGATGRDQKWPLNHIDWEAAAEELKQDYMSVEFDGTTFWMRS